MTAQYILSGDANELRKILQENRLRCERGLVRFIPCPTYEDGKTATEADSKEVQAEVDQKSPKKKK